MAERGLGWRESMKFHEGVIGAEILWPDALPVTNQCWKHSLDPYPFLQPTTDSYGKVRCSLLRWRFNACTGTWKSVLLVNTAFFIQRPFYRSSKDLFHLGVRYFLRQLVSILNCLKVVGRMLAFRNVGQTCTNGRIPRKWMLVAQS